MNKRPDFLDTPSDLAVYYGYMFLLGRTPESEHITSIGVSSNETIKQLREGLVSCAEYQESLLYVVAKKMWRGFFDSIIGLNYEVNHTSNDILVLQTSDPVRYSAMLHESSGFNLKYAKINNLNYQSFVGIKKGCFPHHATLNRVYLLKELIDQGYRGWVFYLDADCIVSDKNFLMRNELSSLRANGKIMLLHAVYDLNSDPDSWWAINAGAFAIDLSANHARALVSAWAAFYDNLHTEADFKNATGWNTIVNDQNSLHFLLQEMSTYFKIRDELQLGDFQNNVVTQVIRFADTDISTDDEIQERIRILSELGNKIWN